MLEKRFRRCDFDDPSPCRGRRSVRRRSREPHFVVTTICQTDVRDIPLTASPSPTSSGSSALVGSLRKAAPADAWQEREDRDALHLTA
jgi:hypothetical protein